jgi:hypothetical protein
LRLCAKPERRLRFEEVLCRGCGGDVSGGIADINFHNGVVIVFSRNVPSHTAKTRADK